MDHTNAKPAAGATRPAPVIVRSTTTNGRENRTASGNTQHLPKIIAEWPRNRHETIRVALDSFNNRATLDIRTWWSDSVGGLKPGRSGITLAVKHLKQLAPAIADAFEEAKRLGLLDGGDE